MQPHLNFSEDVELLVAIVQCMVLGVVNVFALC